MTALISEAALAHTVKDKTEAAYRRGDRLRAARTHGSLVTVYLARLRQHCFASATRINRVR